jgi:hypothetical protein
MALKRAAAPTETAQTNTAQTNTAAEAVKETVETVETVEANVAAEQPMEAAVEKEVVQSEGSAQVQEAEAEPVAQATAAAEVVEPEAVKAAVEPEAVKAAEVQPEQVAAQQVAVKAESTAVVTNTERQASAAKQFTEDMASQGFEGLNITGMSFDRIKLDEGKFLLGSEEIPLGEEIEVNILSTRNIYIVRQFAGEGAELFYSYDKHGKTLSDGTSAQEILDEWLGDGYGTPDEPLDIKEYIEAMAQLKNREDEYDEHMVSLSIPPASKDRLAGAIAVGVRKNACAPGELIIKAKVGAKVGKGEKAFRPWTFTCVGKL